MITTIKNDQGYVVAFMEWKQVGKSGYDKPSGEYVFVEDVWIHPEFRHKHFLEEMALIILPKVPDAKWCYWKREKYFGRVSKLYTREYIEKLAQRALQLA